jgi:hypothetical protein
VATYPFSIGLGIKKGDAPATSPLTASTPNDVKRRWSDGSVKHAIVSGRARRFTQNVAKEFAVSTGTQASGAALTSDIEARRRRRACSAVRSAQ